MINKQYIGKLEPNLISYQIINKKSISYYQEFENKNPKIKYFEKENKDGKQSENKESKTPKNDNVQHLQ